MEFFKTIDGLFHKKRMFYYFNHYPLHWTKCQLLYGHASCEFFSSLKEKLSWIEELFKLIKNLTNWYCYSLPSWKVEGQKKVGHSMNGGNCVTFSCCCFCLLIAMAMLYHDEILAWCCTMMLYLHHDEIIPQYGAT
jgi:hypothetical protein